ncbi:MAG: M42 family metallopeptidase [Lachnospiraceae bacterium]|nr:M42 family metallopeptidase [Lachnospiraceae bacterium]
MNEIDYIVEQLETLVNIPSPSGYTKQAMAYVEKTAKELGFTCTSLRKGGVVIHVPGKNPTEERVIGLSAHVDTLGAMVRSINSNGTLRMTSIGGFMMESVESTYCKVHTREGKTYTGTILTKAPAVHTFDDARTMERKEKNMEVRLDEVVTKKEEVVALGIETGDYISFDPCFVACESGYIKSRHLDDKASVAVLLGLLKYMKESGKRPECDVRIVITGYEEIGFGASFIPQEITEFVAVDMGAVGDDLAGEERKVSICAKDAAGAYDYDLTGKLITIAKEKKLDYVVDVFPHYSSDVSAALKGGNNICGALIGPGVQASHNIERTHKLGLKNTLELLKGYLEV